MFPRIEALDPTVHRALSWDSYESLLADPDRLKSVLKRNALFVIHPGFCDYYPHEKSYLRPRDYREYEANLRHAVDVCPTSNWTLIVFTPRDYLTQTLKFIGYPPKAILIPTQDDYAVRLDTDLLAVTDPQSVWKTIARNVKYGYLCGEYGEVCAATAENLLFNYGISCTRLERCIYYAKEGKNPYDW